MISNRTCRQLRDNLSSVCEKVFVHIEKDLLNSITKMLSANTLYVHLFGSKTPISATVTFHPKLQELSSHFPASRKLKDPANYLNVDIVEGSLRLPLTETTVLVVPGLKGCQDFEAVVKRGDYSWSQHSYCTIEDCRHEFAAPYVEKCRTLLSEVIGTDFMEALDRISNLRAVLLNLPNAFGGYVKSCHSMGGLYKKLPVLNTILPAFKVDHVTMTRLTPDPPPELVEKLNIVAALLGTIKVKA